MAKPLIKDILLHPSPETSQTCHLATWQRSIFDLFPISLALVALLKTLPKDPFLPKLGSLYTDFEINSYVGNS